MSQAKTSGAKPQHGNVQAQGTRVVWKPAFASPLRYTWPDIPDEAGRDILQELLKLLNGDGLASCPDVIDATNRSEPVDVSILNYRNRTRRLKRHPMCEGPCFNRADDKMIIDELVTLPPSKPGSGKPSVTARSFKTIATRTASVREILRAHHTIKLRSGRLVKIPDFLPPRTLQRGSIALKQGQSQSMRPNIQRPPILDHLLSGANSITKALENEIRHKIETACPSQSSDRSVATSSQDVGMEFKFEVENQVGTLINASRALHVTGDATSDQVLKIEKVTRAPRKSLRNEANPVQLLLIFVCKDDLNPTGLLDYLLPTVAAVNHHRLLCNELASKNQTHQSLVFITPLPVGAETQLAASLGIKRAAVVALHGDNPQMSHLGRLVEKYIQPILPLHVTHRADSLPKQPTNEACINRMTLIPTHIKHYKTTAPSDMRKHQSERALKKKQVKLLRRQKKQELCMGSMQSNGASKKKKQEPQKGKINSVRSI